MQYYAGFEQSGLYLMYPSSDYGMFSKNTYAKDDNCTGVAHPVEWFDPRCRPWYRELMESP